MGLVFEVAAPLASAGRHRADVACFIGHVARRPGQPLPDALRAQLDAAGWTRGPWGRSASQVQSLLNLPLVIDSWHIFDRLYAWDQRPVDGLNNDNGNGSSPRRCATLLGAAVRSFFAHGGRRAVVLRVGEPWPVVEEPGRRAVLRRQRLRRLLPDFADIAAPNAPFEPHNPAAWQGIHHLYGLRETSLLLLPDLPDACAADSLPAPAALPTVLPPETFVECSVESVPALDLGLRRLAAPRLDARGYAAWQLAVSSARAFLQRWQPEVNLVAALPLPHEDAVRVQGTGRLHAQADMPGFLRRIGALLPEGSAQPVAGSSSSAFVQLAWPWLRCQDADDLPQGLAPPDGVLAGLIAGTALQRGTFRSAAGDASLAALRDVADAEPVPAWGGSDNSPVARLARRVCVIAPGADGWALQSDVTTSPQAAWRFGGASRLMGLLLRASRRIGESLAFEPSGPLLWARARGAVEDLLIGFWREGALAGATAQQAFSVQCGRATMTPADLDAGRLIVRISVRPAAAIERITVVLNLGNPADAHELVRAAA